MIHIRGCVESNETVHTVTDSNGNGNSKVAYIYIYAFLSVAVAVTKWVHNPFNKDTVAVTIAVGHHVSCDSTQPIHEGKKVLSFACHCRLSVNEPLCDRLVN